ncbi:MAG: NAD(P)-dependent glycerol-3-phosphate dehydrogenase [Candidatus Ratteibacteria bacterium]|nr:NAD(P)-dependent glycerol-3-phosphate dehydrogenase [Candidatus Ratteibacteria bacterium]
MEKNIGVLGAGGWGITLTLLLEKQGHRLILWEPVEKNLSILKKKRESPDYFPDFKIPESVYITGSIKEVISCSDIIILVVRSTFFRKAVKHLKKFYRGQPILVGTKGIEISTEKSMSEILISELGRDIPFAILSGPTIAKEIAKGMPSAAVVATYKKNIGILFQKMLGCETLRIYTTTDIKGVEIGGAFKNVIAIGAGIVDGLGLGINTKSAYLTRGLNEMIKIGCRLGGREKTFRGLSGIGDIITTSFSPFSRNRSFGEAIVRTGKEKYLKENKMVIEGLFSTKTFYRLSRKMNIELPITESIYKIIYKNVSPEIEIKKLMTRRPKKE